ncbi:MAG: TlpA family protein disulfide reductase [Nocardioides sp.]
MIGSLLRAAAGLLVVVLLAACGAPHLTPPPPSDIKLDAPDMVATKAKSRIEDCPKPQTAAGSGGLPAFTIQCLGGGRAVDLSTLKGPLVLNFWWQGCVPCQKEMPALAAFYKQYGDQVPILGVDSTDVYPGVALKKAIKWGVTFPLVGDPGGDLQGTKLTIKHYPSFYFLSADGTLTGPIEGGLDSVDEVKAMVEKQLGVSL